ncbi:MAG: HEAT repeat domain-containing protein [Candidatus Ratteibacteria bacterium]|jgi:HEAT repeat protein
MKRYPVVLMLFLALSVIPLFAFAEISNEGIKSLPALIGAAKKDVEPVRQNAIRILGDLKAEEAVPLLTNYLGQETDTETTLIVQIASLEALNKIGTSESISALEQYGLKHKNDRIVLAVAELLIFKKKEKAVSALNSLANSIDPGIRYQAATFLIENKEKTGIPILIGLLQEKKYLRSAINSLKNVTGYLPCSYPTVVRKEFNEEYTKKWRDWWENNKNTFEFKK